MLHGVAVLDRDPDRQRLYAGCLVPEIGVDDDVVQSEVVSIAEIKYRPTVRGRSYFSSVPCFAAHCATTPCRRAGHHHPWSARPQHERRQSEALEIGHGSLLPHHLPDGRRSIVVTGQLGSSNVAEDRARPRKRTAQAISGKARREGAPLSRRKDAPRRQRPAAGALGPIAENHAFSVPTGP